MENAPSSAIRGTAPPSAAPVRPLGTTRPSRVGLRNAIYILDKPSLELIYGDTERREIARLLNICSPPQTRESTRANLSLLADVEVILSGWGAPVMDEEFLAAAPNLRAVFYGAGSIRYFTTDAFWKRNIIVTSAYAANAVPVAEYTLGVVLLSLKHFWKFAAAAKCGEGYGDHTRPVPGAFRQTIGLISCGMVGRLVRERLRPFDLDVVAYDPFMTTAEAAQMHVRPVSLEELFRVADVVSLHTPWLKETEGMITGDHLRSMKPGATFINTARGAIVRQAELIEALRQRPDLTAVLDVTHPEPTPAGAPLLQLPNVVVTPHIAGSMGSEINRLGQCMVEELRRFLAGKPLKWQITPELAATLA